MTSIVIGDGPDLPGIPSVVLPTNQARLRDAHFDNDTDSWTITTADGRSITAQTIIDARPSDDATVAVHGMPNLFRVPGPDRARQVQFVRRCLDLLRDSGTTRIEAKARIVLRRWLPQAPQGRFYLTGGVPEVDDMYRGPASVSLPDRDVDVRAQLAGHVDAIDGQYHWRGTISGDMPDDVLKGQRTVTISTTSRSVVARVVERTPWGGYTVTGVGSPPF